MYFQRLKKGDKVALVAPAGPITLERLKKTVSILENLGLVPVWSNNILKRWGYLAGTDEQRLADLCWAYTDPGIKAVFAVRGGYGTTRLLNDLNYRFIRRNKKFLFGFSDITALQMALYKKAGLISLHAHTASLEYDFTKEIFHALMFRCEPIELDFVTDFTPQPSVLKPGFATGRLLGGNLSLLVSLIGTGFLPKFRNNIVFIEEVNEPPYKIDRMLTQLLTATDLLSASGIVFGIFNKCNRKDFYNDVSMSLSLKEVLLDRLKFFPGPIIGGFPLGHIEKMSILPIGAKVALDTQKLKIKLLKPICR